MSEARQVVAAGFLTSWALSSVGVLVSLPHHNAAENLVLGALIWVTVLGLLLSVGLAILVLCQRLDTRMRQSTSKRLPGYCLASPCVVIGLHLVTLPMPALAVSLALVLGLSIVAYQLGRRLLFPTSLLFGAGLGVVGFLSAADAVWLFDRVPAQLFSMELSLVFLGTVLVVITGVITVQVSRFLSGKTIPALLRVVSFILATLIVSLCVVAWPGTYPTPRDIGFYGACLLFLVTVLPWTRRLSSWALGSLVGVPIAAVIYTIMSAPLSFALQPQGFTSHHKHLISAIGNSTFERYKADLKARVEAGVSEHAVTGAGRYNASAPKLPVDTRGYSVLLITVDALRYDHVGYSGSALDGLTPNLDKLARRSQRFSRAYAQGGWTSLSMPALLWSKYPKNISFEPVYEDHNFNLYLANERPAGKRFNNVFQAPVHEKSASMARVFSKAGIKTVAVPNDGYTHYFDPRLGFTQGFEIVRYPRQAVAVGDEVPDEQAVRLAQVELNRLRSEQFMMWVHLYGPHAPYKKRVDSGDYSGYPGEVHAVDAQIGRLLAATDLQRTIVVLTSDHGEQLGRHGRFFHGLNLYESGIRIPLLIAIPGVPATDNSSPVSLVDVAPTVLQLAGLAVPDSMQGYSLLKIMTGETAVPRPPVFVETWRNEVDKSSRSLHLLGAIDGDHKVIWDRIHNGLYYYDLKSDPDELKNILAHGTSDERAPFEALASYLLGWYSR